MKVLWICTNKISTEEDVQDTKDERYLFTGTDNFRVTPSLSELVHAVLHLLAVPVQLLIGLRDSASPFLNHAFPRRLCLGLDRFPRATDLVCLSCDALL